MDQSVFISSLLKSFQDSSPQTNEFFTPTLTFLNDNWFLEPLVCSLRAVMSQGFLMFPDWTKAIARKSFFQNKEFKFKLQVNKYTKTEMYEHFTHSFLSIIYGIITKTLKDKLDQTAGKT